MIRKTTNKVPRRSAGLILLLCSSISGPLAANPHAPSATKPPQALNRRTLLVLEDVARRTQETMMRFKTVETRVWPHGVRDQHGRQGLFIAADSALLSRTDAEAQRLRQAWVVCGLIAAVKHAEGSQLGHLGFTETRAVHQPAFYYDLDMATAREIHRLLSHGVLSLEQGYRMINASWRKISVDREYAIE